jgi:hypothetical protein
MKNSITIVVAVAATALCGSLAESAVITTGDPTTGLVPSVGPAGSVLFLDDASIGGTDTNNATAAATTSRLFDLNAAAGAPGIAGTVKVTGFGFAVPGPGGPPRANNTATSVTIAFSYLGLNGVAGGGDDVPLGTTAGLVWAADLPAANTYYVNFDTALTASIDGLNENFAITITPTGGNYRFKATTGTALSAAKFSVGGSFTPVPEPASLSLLAGLPLLLLGKRHRTSSGDACLIQKGES